MCAHRHMHVAVYTQRRATHNQSAFSAVNLANFHGNRGLSEHPVAAALGAIILINFE